MHRQTSFNRSWMDYGTLRRGSNHVVPLAEQEAEWRQDDKAMNGEMFFGEVPEFDEVLRVMRKFQMEFNGDCYFPAVEMHRLRVDSRGSPDIEMAGLELER